MVRYQGMIGALKINTMSIITLQNFLSLNSSLDSGYANITVRSRLNDVPITVISADMPMDLRIFLSINTVL